MGRFFRRLWRYLGASANSKLDERADPKIQIQQAIEEAQKQHARLTQQAAAVIGNQHQIEMKMARAMEDTQKLQQSARQALVLAQKQRDAGAPDKAAEYESAAQSFAGQLVTVEAQLTDLKNLHVQATQSAAAAHQAVEQNRVQLEQRLNERTKLMTQLEQAKMQEQMNKAMSSVSELSAPGPTPTLEAVRERIESRYATALGSSEIQADSAESRMLEVQKATLDSNASARLDEIRAQLTGGGTGGGTDTAAVTAGAPADTPAVGASSATPAAEPAEEVAAAEPAGGTDSQG